MHWTFWLNYCVMIPWLVLGCFYTRSSGVLFLQWLTCELWWWHSGDQLPFQLYLVTDVIAIVFIYIWRVQKDWLILSIYPPMIATYFNVFADFGAKLTPAAQWWLLLVMFWAQAFIAGPWPVFARNRTIEGRRGLVGGIS